MIIYITLEIRARLAKVQEHTVMSPFPYGIERLCKKHRISE